MMGIGRRGMAAMPTARSRGSRGLAMGVDGIALYDGGEVARSALSVPIVRLELHGLVAAAARRGGRAMARRLRCSPLRATATVAMGDLEGQITALEAMLRIDPGDSVASNWLGYLLADHGMELSRAEALIGMRCGGNQTMERTSTRSDGCTSGASGCGRARPGCARRLSGCPSGASCMTASPRACGARGGRGRRRGRLRRPSGLRRRRRSDGASCRLRARRWVTRRVSRTTLSAGRMRRDDLTEQPRTGAIDSARR